MKKKILFTLLILLSLFTFTGCGSNKRSFHNLLNQYVEAYAHIKIDALKDVYPPFYVEYAKDSLTEKNLEKNVEQLKKLYGDDFKLSYKIIDSVKLTDEELEELNSKMTKKYGAKEDASECYKYNVTIEAKGSKGSRNNNTSMGYCKYGNTWYLVSVKV